MERDGWRCLACGADADLTIDHKTPPDIYRGRYDAEHPSNLLTLCRACNSRKARATWPEFVRRIGKPELDRQIRNHVRQKVRPIMDRHRMERYARAFVEAEIRAGRLARIVDHGDPF